MPFHRHDGSEADDGEAGRAQDPLRVEKNDRRGNGRQQQQHHQLQRLCQDDAGQTFSCAQTVSHTHTSFSNNTYTDLGSPSAAAL